ncbi:hypothetical protein GF323_00315 [Candidatus Woesearchaeota archaeon]|nr:hypothetical protein [Candidatus Woesearchaeota archaeon]
MKKAQSIVISSFLFLLVFGLVISVLVYYFTILNSPGSDYEDYEREARNIGELLTSEAYPTVWDESTVKQIGLLEGDILTEGQLIRFGNLSYTKTKSLLGIKEEYVFYFIDKHDNVVTVTGKNSWQYWGWNGRDRPNGGPDYKIIFDLLAARSRNLATEEKFVKMFVNGKIIEAKMVIHVWDWVEGVIPFLGTGYNFAGQLFTIEEKYAVNEAINLTMGP